jgi:hypothetical protein
MSVGLLASVSVACTGMYLRRPLSVMWNVLRPWNRGYPADGTGFGKNVEHHWNVICNECDGLSFQMDGNLPHLGPLFHSASEDANEHCDLVTMYQELLLLFHMGAKLSLLGRQSESLRTIVQDNIWA